MDNSDENGRAVVDRIAAQERFLAEALCALGRGIAFSVKVFIGGMVLGIGFCAGIDLWWWHP